MLNFGSSSSITPTLDVNIEEILAIRDGANDLIDAYEGVDDVVKQTAKSLNENVTAQQLSNAAMAQSTASTQMNTTATTANTVAQKAWNVAKSAGNVLLSAGVAIIGTMIATQLLSWLNDVIHAEERFAEAANDAVTNMKDLNSTFEEHKKYVDENIESYEELSKGVDELSNKNVSLSTDEYEKYLEINEQLVEMFPSLKTGIDDNGNSILNLGKNGRSAAEDLNELLEAERKLNDYKISKDAETIYADFQNQYDDYQKLREESDDTVSHLEDNLQKIENLQGKINISDLIISGTSDNQADIEMYNAISEAYQRFIENLDIYDENENLRQKLSFDDFVTWDQDSFTIDFQSISDQLKLNPEELKELENGIKLSTSDIVSLLEDSKSEIESELSLAESDLQSAWENTKEAIAATARSSGSFDILGEGQHGESLQGFINDYINNLDMSMADVMGDDHYGYIRQEIVNQLINFDDNEKKEFSEAYQKLLELNPNDLTEQNQKAIDELVRQIALMLNAAATEEDIANLRLNIGFIVDDDYQANYNEAIGMMQEKYGLDRSGADDIITELGIDSQDEILSWIDILSVVGNTLDDLAEAKNRFKGTISEPLFSDFEGTPLGERLTYLAGQFEAGEVTYRDYFNGLRSEIESVDFSPFTNSVEEADAAMQQLFTDSVQQTASGLSDLINGFDNGEMGVTEYLEGYLSIGETLSTLTDSLQENSSAWNENGEALSDNVNNSLDATQDKLSNAMSTIESYQDSIYSLEQIMSGAVDFNSDEWTAHVNVISADLSRIVAEGGAMATEIKNAMGTTTAEIAQNLTNNVDNQAIAAQAIAANTNAAIVDMAEAVGELFDALGNAIQNFKVDISFGIKSIDWSTVEILGNEVSLPKINFELGATSDSLTAVGDAIKGFGSQIKSNIESQMIELPDFSYTPSDSSSVYTPSSDVTKNYEDELERVQESAKDSASGTQDAFEETFDFFERRVKVLEDAFGNLESAIENVIGAEAKNTLLSQQIGILDEEVNNYTDALAMYRAKADEALSGIDSTLRDKIVNGAVSLTDFVGDGNEEVVQAMEDYQGWADKVAECTQKLEELKTQIRQLELEKFNNIVEDFTNQFDLFGDSIDLIDQQIGLLEEAGQLIGESFYQAQIDQAKKQLSTLEAERNSLVDQLSESLSSGRIQQGTDEWLEMVNALTDVESSILDCKTSIEEFDNALLELHWEIFDRVQTEFGNIADELDNLSGLFDDYNDIAVSDGEGTWTDQAIATLGLYAQQYELAKYQVQQYSEAIDQLNYDYKNGKYSVTEYMDKLAELNQGQWDAVNSAEAIEDAIISLNEARVNEEIETIEEAIDAYKEYTDAQIEAIEAAEDLRDMQDTLAEKTKAVADLERQIAAMQNDDTASTVAQRKLLEERLAEARKDLADTEHDYEVEAKKDALNKNYEAYEEARNAEIEALQETLKNRELLISQSFETVKANASLVGEQIALIAQEHGIVVSNAVITPWQNGSNAIAEYGSVLTAQSSAFIAQLTNVEGYVYNLQNQANVTAQSLAYMFSTRADNLVSQLIASYNSEANLANMTNALQNSLINTLERGYDISSITSALSSIASGANSVASAANNAADALSRMGMAQSSATDLGSENRTKYRIVDTKYGRTIESDLTYQEAKQNLYTKYRDTSKYLTIMRMAKGGIITKDDNNPLNEIAKSVGEDVLIAAKDQESVLTPIQTQGLLKLAPMLENLSSGIIPKVNVPDYINNKSTNSGVELNCKSLFEFNGDFNNTDQLLAAMEGAGTKAAEKLLNRINRNFKV